jgi:hypothetical protein
LCQSLDTQTERDWEHLVVVDAPAEVLTGEQRRTRDAITSHPNRSISYCDQRHKNYGHSCRHRLWEKATAEYILYVDDDDYFARPDALMELNRVSEPWAVFPILRHGEIFLQLPPGIGNTGTGMFMHRREIGRWPDSDSYQADGCFVEELRRKFPYHVLHCAPLVIQPRSSAGVSNVETWIGDKLARLASQWIRRRATPLSFNAGTNLEGDKSRL